MVAAGLSGGGLGPRHCCPLRPEPFPRVRGEPPRSPGLSLRDLSRTSGGKGMPALGAFAAQARGTRRDGSQRFLRQEHFRTTPEQNSEDLAFQDMGAPLGPCQGLEPHRFPKCCEGSSGIVLILGMNLNS